MTSLVRVPAPRSPFGGWGARVAGLVALGICVAIVKPWGDGEVRPIYSPMPAASAVVDPAPQRAPAARYDAIAYGPTPPPATWALLTPGETVGLPFLGREAGAGGDGTGATVDTIVSGPVAAIGRSGPVLSLGLSHPADAEVLSARLWSLGGPSPARIELRRMASPWTGAHAVVLARQGPDGVGSVLPWEPGLYRLDLLIGPARVARSVMITVDGGAAHRPAVSPAPSPDPAATGVPSAAPDRAEAVDGFLDVLPEGVSLWTAGQVLTGWNRGPAATTCTILDLWGAMGPTDACWPVPIGDVTALGVDLEGATIRTIELVRLDPLPGAIESVGRTGARGRAGLAFVLAPDGGLPDGIYRLDVGLTTGPTRSWYVEVGPVGRAVARLEQASARR